MPTVTSRPGEYAARIELGPVVSGDDWDGHDFRIRVRTSAPNVTPVTWGPPDDDLTAVTMQFHTSEDQLDNLFELTSAAAEITITSAANWEFTVEEVAIPLAAGTYFFGIRCTKDGGGFKTYIIGTFPVQEAPIV